MGGANIRAFASLFKNDVAGLVFIDPATEQILNVLSAKEREAEFERQEAALKDAPPGVRAEWRLLKEGTLNKFSELQSFGTLRMFDDGS
jgi:pimeloyl-ACP methyl ester carboxylesterase